MLKIEEQPNIRSRSEEGCRVDQGNFPPLVPHRTARDSLPSCGSSREAKHPVHKCGRPGVSESTYQCSRRPRKYVLSARPTNDTVIKPFGHGGERSRVVMEEAFVPPSKAWVQLLRKITYA